MTTIGLDFTHKTIDLDGENFKLQIWDICGGEKFRTNYSLYNYF